MQFIETVAEQSADCARFPDCMEHDYSHGWNKMSTRISGPGLHNVIFPLPVEQTHQISFIPCCWHAHDDVISDIQNVADRRNATTLNLKHTLFDIKNC